MALDYSDGFVKAVGALDTLGAVCLILTHLVDIVPILVALAAVGLGLIMLGAATSSSAGQDCKHVALDLTYLVPPQPSWDSAAVPWLTA